MATITPANDPGYKYSVARFTGDGGKTDWEFNFAGGYIRREHVKAYTLINGVYTPLTISWVGDNTVRITPAVPLGITLVIRRETPKDIPLVDFTDGAIINERNLDANAEQSVFVAAEMVDAFGDVTLDSNTAIATANEALLASAGAVAVAGEATSTASTALAGASSAVAVAGQANAKSDTAITTANAAGGKADAATSAAAIATGRADSALTTAGNANTTANAAAAQSAAAEITAGNAVNTAGQANTRALDAQGAAANAVATANQADTKANAVRSEFDALADSVEEIAGGDLTNFVRTNVSNYFTIAQRFQQGFSLGPPGDNFTIRSDGKFRYSSAFEWADFGKPAWSDVRDKPTTFPSTWAEVGGKPTDFAFQNVDTAFRDLYVRRNAGDSTQGYVRMGADGQRGLLLDNNGIFYLTGAGSQLFVDGSRVWTTGTLNPALKANLAGDNVYTGTQIGPLFATAGGTNGYVTMSRGTSGLSGDITFRASDGTLRGYIGSASATRIEMVGPYAFGTRPIFGTATPWDTSNLPRPVGMLNAGDSMTVRSNVSLGRMEMSSNLISGWYTLPREGAYDVTFKDGTFTRGDGTGYLFLGGGAYFGHDGTDYVLGGTKRFVTGGNLLVTGSITYRGGAVLPKITVGGSAPASPAVGDLWFE